MGRTSRESGELALELGGVEIAVDQIHILDVPQPMPIEEGAHQRPDIIKFGLCRGLENLDHHTPSTTRRPIVGQYAFV